MKKIINFKLIKELKSKPATMKKMKVFVVVGLVGVLIIGGLTVWTAVTATRYLASSVHQVVTSSLTQEKIHSIKKEFKNMNFRQLDCWGKAESLLSLQPWFEKPALDNFRSLKIACLDSKPAICEGNSCEQMKDFFNTAEGRTI